MTVGGASGAGVRAADPFDRVLTWRARGVWTRGAQAVLVAVLAPLMFRKNQQSSGGDFDFATVAIV